MSSKIDKLPTNGPVGSRHGYSEGDRGSDGNPLSPPLLRSPPAVKLRGLRGGAFLPRWKTFPDPAGLLPVGGSRGLCFFRLARSKSQVSLVVKRGGLTAAYQTHPVGFR